jgi:hypothetical protein
MTWTRLALAPVLAVFVTLPPAGAADKDKKPAEEQIARANGLTLTVRMQGPYDADVPLQIVCYFRKKDGQTLKVAPVELDKRLGGVIANLRDRGEFVGDELETLIIDTKRMIPAKMLLLIGLGDEKDLTLDRMERVGQVAYREAAKLGATRVAFAPLLRDQGSDKLPTGDVGRYVVRGLLLARDTDTRLQKEGLAGKFALEEWIAEAGRDFYKETITGVKQGLEEANATAKKRRTDPFINPSK